MVQTTQHSVTKRPVGQRSPTDKDSSLALSLPSKESLRDLRGVQRGPAVVKTTLCDKAALRVLKDHCVTKRPFGQRIAAQRFAITPS
jgi:hypothetical protein